MIELAVRYRPNGLLQRCSKALKDSIKVDTVFHILSTAEFFELNEIAADAFQFAIE